MFGFCSDFSEVKDTLSFTLSLAVCRHGYYETGEGGIRTLGSLLSYGALAKRCFQPLSHLTNAEREYRGELLIANIRI
jgi:hypothetical protein